MSREAYEDLSTVTGEMETRPVPQPPNVGSVTRLFLAAVLLLITIGSVAQALSLEMGILVTEWALILLPALWYWKRYKLDRKDFVRLKPLEMKYVPFILLLAGCAWVLVASLEIFLNSYLMRFGYTPISIPPPTTFQQLISYYILFAFSAGVCEEVLFRGTIMPALERYGRFQALLFSSLLFGLLHMSFIRLPLTFVLGLFMGAVVIKTGSLLAGILYHFFNNFVSMTYAYLVVNYELGSCLDSLSNWDIGALLVLAAAGFVFSFKTINRLSPAPPVFENRTGWLPRGWFNWATFTAVILFIIMAAFELMLGFGVFDAVLETL